MRSPGRSRSRGRSDEEAQADNRVLAVAASVGKVESLKRNLAKMVATFQHVHTAYYRDGGLTDTCGSCGLDLRDEVHLRVEPNKRHFRESGEEKP